MNDFTKWLPSLNTAKRDEKDPDPIPSLIKLYSDNVLGMEELSRCRINPDLRATQRRDLEFFIPQICSFFITGYYSD